MKPMEELKLKMEAAADKADDPVIEGIVALGDEMATATKEHKLRTDALEKQIEEDVTKEREDRKKELAKIDAKIEAGFGDVVDRVELLNKRSLATGRITSGNWNPAEKLLSAIDDKQRKHINQAQIQIDSERRSGADARASLGGDDAILRGAAAVWFAEATMAQAPRTFGQRRSQEAMERIDRLNAAFEDVYGKADYGETTATTGPELVPTIVGAEVLRVALDSSVVAQRMRRFPMTSNATNIPNEATGVSTAWIADESPLGQREGTFGTTSLIAKKLASRATASIELVEDSVVAFLPYIQSVMGEAIGRELDQEIIDGDGTNHTGLVTESSVNSVSTTTTDGEALTYADLVATMYKAGEESTRMGAAWIMNPQVFGTVVGLVDSNGMPVFQYASVPNSPFPTLLGRPVYLTNVADVDITRGATGSTGNVYFGDPRTLILGVRQDFRWDVSDAPNWGTYQLDMRLVGRFAETVGLPAAWTKLVGCTLLGA